VRLRLPDCRPLKRLSEEVPALEDVPVEESPLRGGGVRLRLPDCRPLKRLSEEVPAPEDVPVEESPLRGGGVGGVDGAGVSGGGGPLLRPWLSNDPADSRILVWRKRIGHARKWRGWVAGNIKSQWESSGIDFGLTQATPLQGNIPEFKEGPAAREPACSSSFLLRASCWEARANSTCSTCSSLSSCSENRLSMTSSFKTPANTCREKSVSLKHVFGLFCSKCG